jgi:Protein of unknown function (DUF1279)
MLSSLPSSLSSKRSRSLLLLGRNLSNFNNHKNYTSIYVRRRFNNDCNNIRIVRSFYGTTWNHDDGEKQDGGVTTTRTVGVSLLNERLHQVSDYSAIVKQQQLLQQIRWSSSTSSSVGIVVGTNLHSYQDSSSSSSSSSVLKAASAKVLNTTKSRVTFSTSSFNQDNATVNKGGSMLDNMKHRAHCKFNDARDAARDKYNDMRDDARETYQDFKEHPRESAKAGAKSITDMIRLYGPVFLGTYGIVYITTLGGLYTGVQSGLLDPITLISTIKSVASSMGTEAVAGGAAAEAVSSNSDTTIATTTAATTTYDFVVDFMNTHTMTRPYVHIVESYPYIANLAVAWIAVKFTEPLRLGVSIYLTPRVARYLGYNKNTNDNQVDSDKVSDTATGTGTTITTTTSNDPIKQ